MAKKQFVVGFSGKMGSGKSFIAAAIKSSLGTVGITSVIVPYAKPLKDVATLLGWDGKKDAKGRRLLQLLGTECVRKCIDEDRWVKMHYEHILQLKEDIILVDDVRFNNEASVVDRLIHIKDPDMFEWPIKAQRLMAKVGLVHASELPLARKDFTYYNIKNVNNDGALADLILYILMEYNHGQ